MAQRDTEIDDHGQPALARLFHASLGGNLDHRESRLIGSGTLAYRHNVYPAFLLYHFNANV